MRAAPTWSTKKGSRSTHCQKCWRPRKSPGARCTYCKRAWNKSWEETNKKKVSDKNRKSRLKFRYGITIEEYDALYAKQKGRCGICKSKKRELVIDHCHKSGKVRGLLCRKCNLALGHFDDSLKKLAQAVAYLAVL